MTTNVEHGSAAGGRLVFYVGIALLAANILTVLVLWLRVHHVETKTHDERVKGVDAGLTVVVFRVEVVSKPREITLPAEVNAFNQTTVYAKISGYVREMRVERGARVKEGQALAILESPENARDVASARSDL